MSNNPGTSTKRNPEEELNDHQSSPTNNEKVQQRFDPDDSVHKAGIELTHKHEELDADDAVHRLRPSAPRHPERLDPDDLVHGA